MCSSNLHGGGGVKRNAINILLRCLLFIVYHKGLFQTVTYITKLMNFTGAEDRIEETF